MFDFSHPCKSVGGVKLAAVHLEGDFLDVVKQGRDGDFQRDLARQLRRSQVLRELESHLEWAPVLLRYLSREQRLALGGYEATLALGRHRPVQDEVDGVRGFLGRVLHLFVLELLVQERLQLGVVFDGPDLLFDLQDRVLRSNAFLLFEREESAALVSFADLELVVLADDLDRLDLRFLEVGIPGRQVVGI